MKRIVLFLLIFNLISCIDNKENNIMTEKQMVDFLFDVNLINASRGFQNKSEYNYFAIRDSNLFKKHEIDCLKFVNSNNYYIKNPKLYLKIYEKLSEKIKKIKDSVKIANN